MPMSPRLLRPRAAVSTAFDPRTIAALEFWIDADDGGSVTLDSGRVATINDKSGKGRHASNLTSGSTQPSYITAGRNGRNVMRFVSASIQRLSAGAVGDFDFLHKSGQATSFLVFSSLDFTTRSLFGTSTGGELPSEIGAHMTISTTGRVITRIVGGSASSYVSASVIPTNSLTADTLALVQWGIDLTKSTVTERESIGVNSDSDIATAAIGNTAGIEPSASSSSYPLWIGRRATSGAAALSGDVAEMLLFSRQLSSAESAAVRSYLYAKWGITGT